MGKFINPAGFYFSFLEVPAYVWSPISFILSFWQEKFCRHDWS